MHTSRALLAIGGLLFSLVYGQAPNTLKGTYPTDRTQSTNGTWLLVPMNKTVVQGALPSNYSLLSPANYPSIFPKRFPDGMHPVIVSNGFGSDIFMQAAGVDLEIPSLSIGSVYIPFVDRLKDGKTPFTYPLFALIGGDNRQVLAPLVPATVGTLEGGSVLYPGTFSPDANAYRAIDATNNPGLFTVSAGLNLVPNPVSGPSAGVDPIYQMEFAPTAESPYTAHTFHSIINQPQIQPNGQCLPNTMFFDNPYADPFMTNGTVMLYADSLPDTLGIGLPKSFAGTFTNVFGYAATAENLGPPNEDCATAAANVPPSASN